MERRLRARVLWSAAVVVAVAGGVALGAVRSKSPPLDEAVTIGGTLTYVWHGDPARGCAASGLCGAHGSLIVHFDGFGELTARGGHGSLNVGGASATARVLRNDPGSQTGECVDTVSADSVGVSLRRVRVGHWIATLDAASVSGGRCAGPLARDLARLQLPASTLHAHGIGFDLHGHALFAGGPFSGELLSTMALRPDTSEQTSTGGGGDGSTGGFSPPPPRPRPRHVLVEYARVTYRITGATGALGVSFTGDGEPACVPLDNCGTTGTLRMSVSGFRGTMSFAGAQTVPRRVGLRRAIADLRSGRLLAIPFPFDSQVRGSTVTESLTRAGSGRCDDAVVVPTVMSAQPAFGRNASGIEFTLARSGNGSDPWRTHCPGPTSADVVGVQTGPGFYFDNSYFADGSLPRTELGADAAVALAIRGNFAGAGYSGTRNGAVRFKLTLLRVVGGTRVETVRG